jgi:hypothetical protein
MTPPHAINLLYLHVVFSFHKFLYTGSKGGGRLNPNFSASLRIHAINSFREVRVFYREVYAKINFKIYNFRYYIWLYINHNWNWVNNSRKQNTFSKLRVWVLEFEQYFWMVRTLELEVYWHEWNKKKSNEEVGKDEFDEFYFINVWTIGARETMRVKTINFTNCDKNSICI